MEEIEILKTKVAYYEQENASLRAQILDLQIRAGHVSLKGDK